MSAKTTLTSTAAAPWTAKEKPTSFRIDERMRPFLSFLQSPNLELEIISGVLVITDGRNACLIEREGSSFKLDLEPDTLAIDMSVAPEPLYAIIRALGTGCLKNKIALTTFTNYFGYPILGEAYEKIAGSNQPTQTSTRRDDGRRLS
jgi:hypothetical protein